MPPEKVGCTPKSLIAMVIGVTTLLDVHDQQAPPVDVLQQFGWGVGLPAKQHPVRIRARSLERSLNPLRGLPNRNRSRAPAFLEHLHVINGGVAEKLPLLFIEGGGHPGE